MDIIKITFWKRSPGYDWPPFMSTLEFEYDKKRSDPYLSGFSVGGFDFAYDESSYSNGWWATKPGYPGSCQVYIENEEILKS